MGFASKSLLILGCCFEEHHLEVFNILSSSHWILVLNIFMIWSIVIDTWINLFMNFFHVWRFTFFEGLFALPCVDHLVLARARVLVLFLWFSYLDLSLCFIFRFGSFLYSLEGIVWNRIICYHGWLGLLGALTRKRLQEFIFLYLSILNWGCDQIVSRTRSLHWCILRCIYEVCLLTL